MYSPQLRAIGAEHGEKDFAPKAHDVSACDSGGAEGIETPRPVKLQAKSLICTAGDRNKSLDYGGFWEVDCCRYISGMHYAIKPSL